MQISSKALTPIKIFESFGHPVDEDIAGLTTVGYGHKLKDGKLFPTSVIEAVQIARFFRPGGRRV